MDIFADRAALVAALTPAAGVADRRTGNPDHEAAYLSATSAGLTVSSSDSEVGYRSDLAADVQGAGTIATPASGLLAAVKACPAPTVRLRLVGGRLVIDSGHTSYRLPTLAEAQEQAVAVGVALTARLDAGALTAALRRVAYAIGDAPGLAGVSVESEQGRLTLTATDGHRLASTSVDADVTGSVPADLLLPGRAVSMLMRHLPSSGVAVLTAGEGAWGVLVGATLWAVRGLAERYPDWRAVVPTDAPRCTVVVDRAALLAAVRRVGLMTTEAVPMRVTLDGSGVALALRAADRGEAEDSAAGQHTGEAATIGLRARYLADALDAMDCASVTIGATGTLNPVTISGDVPGTVLLMPMRLS